MKNLEAIRGNVADLQTCPFSIFNSYSQHTIYCIYIYLFIYYILILHIYIMRWAGHVARMEEGGGVHKVLVRRPRRRWEDNIKMDLEEVGMDCGDWM
jgi:hypothetical protein